MGIFGLIIGSLCSIGAIATIIHFLKILAFDIALGLAGIGLGGLGVIFICCGKVLLKDLKPNNMEIKELKQKGVKKDKKEENLLKDRKIELKIEESINQSKIREINVELEHIAFYNETANDLFYQADTQEEYDLVIDKDGDYEELFNEYLEEKVDYSNIHFDSIPEVSTLKEEMSLRKIFK